MQAEVDSSNNQGGSQDAGGESPSREAGSEPSERTSDVGDVLQPEVTFGPHPWSQIAHVTCFALASLVSIIALASNLPLSKAQPIANGWWHAVLWPQLNLCVISIAFHIYSISQRERALRMQLGPAPSPQTTSGGAVLQHSLLQRGFRKQYIASNISDMILYIAIAASIAILLARMQDAQTIKWQIVALPVGLGGLAAVITQTMYRVRNRGALPTISTRCDFAIIFIYLAAYKLDGEESLSWTVIFIFLFWWIIAFVLLGLAGLVLYHAGRRARVWSGTDLRVRLSVALMHVSYIVLLVAAGFLFQFFIPKNGNAKLTESRGARLFIACLSLTAAWVLLSSIAWVFVYLGQRKREIEREAQISRGHVWTELANISNEMATVVRQVDALTPEEIIRKAGEMMVGVTRPDRLYRVEVNLWSTAPKPREGGGESESDLQPSDGAQLAPVVAEGSSGHIGDVAIELSASHMSSHSSTSAAPTLVQAGRSQTRERELETCVICMDDVGDHVMMPCGHGGYCRNCAHKLFVRPPNLCPTCRARLTSVVKVSLNTPIGTSSVAE